MEMMLKTNHIRTATPVFPIEVGQRAVLLLDSQELLYTSTVEAVLKRRPDEIIFETKNSIYHVAIPAL